jgi:hypothetical protein
LSREQNLYQILHQEGKEISKQVGEVKSHFDEKELRAIIGMLIWLSSLWFVNTLVWRATKRAGE